MFLFITLHGLIYIRQSFHFWMNREEMPRIRLKVATNAGINILCTALRRWKVAEWLPHIEEAYREVKEEQAEDERSKQRFIKALRIKKGQFYIANSEIIGDVFEDNDEVQCEIVFPNGKKTQNKQRKQQTKQVERVNALTVQPVGEEESKSEEIEEKEEKEGHVFEKHQAGPTPTSTRWHRAEQHAHQQHSQLVLPMNSSKPQAMGNKQTNNNTHPKKVKTQKVVTKPQKKQVLQAIDISKLKKLIIKTDKKPDTLIHSDPNSPQQQ